MFPQWSLFQTIIPDVVHIFQQTSLTPLILACLDVFEMFMEEKLVLAQSPDVGNDIIHHLDYARSSAKAF